MKDLEALRKRLAMAQEKHEAERQRVLTLQAELLEAERTAAAEQYLDSLSEAERGVVVKVAAVRLGSDAGAAQ